MKHLIFSLVLSILLAALLLACAAEKQLPQSESKTIPEAVETGPEWQVEWDRLIADSKKEGRMTLYGAYGLADARDVFIDTVKKKLDLRLEMTVARPPELLQKLTTERRAGLYLADVILIGATSIVTSLVPEKIIDPIEPYLILPEVRDPDLWLGGKLPIWDKERRAFSSLAQVSTRTAINTAFVRQDEVTSYQSLLDPRWKGKLIMSDPTTAGSGHSWAYLAALLMGRDYLRQLAKQEPFLTRDSRLLSEWLARGKYIIGVGVDTGATQNFIRAGAPLWIVPNFKEGIEIRGSAGYVGMINRPAHPNAAKLFLNWILSKEGQTMLSRANGVASRRIDVPTDHLESWQVPDLKANYISTESEEAEKEKFKMLEVFQEIFAPVAR